MKKSKTSLRILSLLLCLSMILGMAPMMQLFTVAEAADPDTGYTAPAGKCSADHAGMTALTQALLSESTKTQNNTTYYQLEAGSYYLSEDITLQYPLWVAGQTIHLDLHGNRIVADASATYSSCHPSYGSGTTSLTGLIIVCGSVAKLDLCDTVGGGKIDGSNVKSKCNGLISCNNTCTFNMYGGTITGAQGFGNGGGVFVNYQAKFYMHGGSVSGNNATNGGGVFVGTNTSTFEMNGGIISGNTATNGGAIARTNGDKLASVTINAGTISGNSADSGSIILANGMICKIRGGEFKDNFGSPNSFLISGTDLEMSGGKVDGNYTAAGKSTKATFKLNNYSSTNGNGHTDAVFSGTTVIGDAGVEVNTNINTTTNKFASTAKINGLTEGANILFLDGYTPETDTTVTMNGDNKYIFNIPWVNISGQQSSFEAGKYYKLANHVNLTAKVTISGNVTIDLAGYEITGTEAPYFTVAPGAKLTIMDSSAEKSGKIIGLAEEKNSQSPMILVNCLWSPARDGGTLVINGGTLTGHHRMGGANSGGAILAQNTSTVIMNGGKITGNYYKTGGNSFGGAIGMASDTKVIINGGEISDNEATAGGAVYVTGALTVNGGTISGNSATNGGAFKLGGSGSVTINGGTISGNHATNGGVFSLEQSGSVNINGGEIKENYVTSTGSVAHTNASAGITMTGGKIEDNYGASTFIVSGTKFTMSGGVIDGNFKDNTKAIKATLSINNYLNASEGVFTGTAIVGDAGVDVRAASTGNYTNASKASVGQLSKGASILFVKSASSNTPVVDPEDITVTSVETASTICYAYKNPDPVNISGKISALESGEYNLTGDVDLTGNIAISGSVTIDLNGYKITGATAPYFTVATGAALTIKDSSAEQTGVIQGLSATDVLIRVNGNFNFEGGTITGHKHNGANTLGTIYGASSSAITVSGGKITGNSATRGGAIYNYGGRLTIDGGEIFGNNATYGGAIFGGCSADGTVLSNIVINGGKIFNNTAADSGGGLYTSGNVAITGGEITGNSAVNFGAIAAAATNLVVTGGYIHDNESSKSIADVNLSTTSSGGAPASTASTCDISGNSVILDKLTSQTEIAIHDLKYGAEIHSIKLAQVAEDDDSVELEIDVAAGEYIYTSSQEKSWCDEEHAGHEGWVEIKQSTLNTLLSTDSQSNQYYNLPAGKYYLSENISLDKLLFVSGAAHLDLNGFSINAVENGNYIWAYTNTNTNAVTNYNTMILLRGSNTLKLKLCDSVGGGEIDASAYTGKNLYGIIQINNGAVVNMYGGILTGNDTKSAGAGVAINYRSAFNMYGGKITGNKTTSTGGAVSVGSSYSSFTMHGGVISNNTTTANGGAINASNYSATERATITINGGLIENNSGNNGGAICAGNYSDTSKPYSAIVTINGGIIRGNTAAGRGAAIYGSQVIINGGTIEGNTSNYNGVKAALDIAGYAASTHIGSFAMTGGVVRGNPTDVDVYLPVDNYTATVSGDAYIGNLKLAANVSGSIADLEEGAYVKSNKALAVKTGDPSVAIEGSYIYSFKKPMSNGIYITVTAGSGYEHFANKDLVQVADHNNAANVSTQLGLAIAEATADKTILDNATIKWTSSDESVAKVSASGVVTYGKWGTAVITAAIEGTDFYASINVQVGVEPLKVLFIGNSFSRDSLYYLSTLGLYTDNRITAGYLYEGSATIRDHAKNLLTGTAYTYCKTNPATGDMQLSADGAKLTIPQALKDEQWDYVVLQHGVLNGGYTPTYNSDLEYLVDYIESVVDSDTKLFWNMTWAVKDGMTLENKGLKFAEVYNGSQEIMYNAIINAMDQFIVGDDAPYSSTNANNMGGAKGWGFDGYFFTGAAIQQLRDVADTEPTRDGYHLSHVNGRVTAALSVLKALLPELDLDAIDEIDGLINAINADKEDENYSKYPAEADLSAAALAKIITAVKNAYADATDSDKLPTKLAHNDETKANSAEGVITLGKVDAPLRLHFADIAYAGNEVFTAGYESVVHVTGSTQTNSAHLMQEGAGKLVLWKGNKNFTNAQWQNSYENAPLLEIDESWIQNKGLVPKNGVIYGRYEALQEGRTVYALADPRDPNLVAGLMDVTGDAQKEEVVLFTFWVNYHNNSGDIIDRTCYLMYTYDGGAKWSEPYPIYVNGTDLGYNPIKRGDIAIYEDNHILIPLYSSLYAVELAFNKTAENWEHVASRPLSNHATNETKTLNEISFVAMKLNGEEVTYRMDRESGIVMISYDRGATWTEVGNEKGLIHQPGFTVVDENTIYASWARTKSPRTVYGTLYNIYGNWDDTPTVKVYESGVQNGSHDMGDPSCAYLGDNQVGVVAYDTAYRSIVMSIEDIASDEYQPFVLTEEGDKITYTEKIADMPLTAPDVAYIIEATLSAAGQIKTPSGTVALEAGSVRLAVVGQVVYMQKNDGTCSALQTEAGSTDGKIYATNASAIKIYTYARISFQESVETIWGARPIQLTYSVDPQEFAVAFKSSDESVVTVDNDGLVTIVDEGTATITMTVFGQVEKTCAVTVAPKPLELTDDGEKVIIMQDDFEEDKYQAGINSLWKDYWADKENSFYLFESGDGFTENSNGDLKYNIVDDGNGNQYLQITGNGNSWMATAQEITGDYTVEFDILYTNPSAETGGYGQLNMTPWQNDLRNGGSNEIHGFVNLHVNKYRFQFREKSLWVDGNKATNPDMYCYGNNIITDSANVWDQSTGAVNQWQHVKLSRVNGGLYLKLWQGDTEPEAWTCMLSHSVLRTDMASRFRMQFQSDANRSAYIDNLVVSQRMENPVDITIKDGDTVLSQATVEAGTKIEMPADPVKENHTFIGWFNGETEWDFDDAVTEDLVLIAKYQINQHTVSFGVDATAQTVDHGAKATKPADPTKEGYTFVGWFNGETAYDFNTAVTGNVTLTAKWVINKYTVTFDSGVEAQTVEYGAKATKPADPSKTGYTFAGWYNGNVPYDFNTAVTGNVTLTAKWTIDEYTVAFDSGVEAQLVKHGSKATKPADPTKTGFTFAGWYNGETAYDFNSAVTGNLTLTAKWVINKYTVTFDSGVAAQTVEYGAKATKPADPTKTGYTFVGWFNGETAYDFNSAVTGNLTLTAKWVINKYTVTFDSGVAAQTVEYGAKATKPADPTKEGFVFAGWYKGETAYDFNTAVTGSITLTAKWVEKITIPVSGDENTIHVDVAVEDDVVTIQPIAPEELDKIVGEDVQTGDVVIDLTKLDTEVESVVLPQAAVQQILDAAKESGNDTESLIIKLPEVTVELDDKTMHEITDNVEGDVALTVNLIAVEDLNTEQKKALEDKKTFSGIDITLVCTETGEKVTDFNGGKVTMKVPFEVPANHKANGFSVWYVAEDGKLTKMTTKYEDGHLVFETGHFSDYIIIYEEPAPEGEQPGGNTEPGTTQPGTTTPGGSDEPSKTGDEALLLSVLLMAALSAAALAVIMIGKKKLF